MGQAVYLIAIVAVVVIGLVRGYRSGFTSQVANVLGFCFGVVATRVLRIDTEDWITGWLPGNPSWDTPYIAATMASALIYLLVYYGFDLLSGVLKSIMEPLGKGTLNSLFGSAFCCFKWLMVLSIVFNMMFCLNTSSPALLKSAAASDANLTEEILLLAPAMLGGEDASDLAHRHQLKEARKISRANIKPFTYVSTMPTDLSVRLSA